MVKIDFPKLIAVELPEGQSVTPWSGDITKAVDQAINLNLNGIVKADATWILEPAAGWTVEKLNIGVYKVTHNLGYTNTVISANPIDSGVYMRMLEHNPIGFTVAITANEQPIDANWLFTLARVISQPAQP